MGFSRNFSRYFYRFLRILQVFPWISFSRDLGESTFYHFYWYSTEDFFQKFLLGFLLMLFWEDIFISSSFFSKSQGFFQEFQQGYSQKLFHEVLQKFFEKKLHKSYRNCNEILWKMPSVILAEILTRISLCIDLPFPSEVSLRVMKSLQNLFRYSSWDVLEKLSEIAQKLLRSASRNSWSNFWEIPGGLFEESIKNSWRYLWNLWKIFLEKIYSRNFWSYLLIDFSMNS